jgi:hypothetical protein
MSLSTSGTRLSSKIAQFCLSPKKKTPRAISLKFHLDQLFQKQLASLCDPDHFIARGIRVMLAVRGILGAWSIRNDLNKNNLKTG